MYKIKTFQCEIGNRIDKESIYRGQIVDQKLAVGPLTKICENYGEPLKGTTKIYAVPMGRIKHVDLRESYAMNDGWVVVVNTVRPTGLETSVFCKSEDDIPTGLLAELEWFYGRKPKLRDVA